MRLVVRKGPVRQGAPKGTPPMVVIELWMETTEAHGLDLNGIALGSAIGNALTTHLADPGRRALNVIVEK